MSNNPILDKKRLELKLFCDSQDDCGSCPIYMEGRGCSKYCIESTMPEDWVNKLYEMAFQSRIRDSGERREFSTGAVRDIQEGKGRCDLMPLDVVAAYMNDRLLEYIHNFVVSGAIDHLYSALIIFRDRHYCLVGGSDSQNTAGMMLAVAKHFEDGAKKYGENNWQKGIPVHCYIDSAIRHYLKFLRGDKDEPHDRAFCWNILCCIWTCNHHPELNEYEKKQEADK